MGKINLGRVVLGGIVGGFVAGFLDWILNGVLMGQRWADAMKSLNRPTAFTGTFLVSLFLVFCIGGIVLVWLYAAIRPRFGAGMRTAVYAALTVWSFGALTNVIDAVTGLYGRRLMLYTTFAYLVELIVGALIGCSLYKEAESTAADYPATAQTRQAVR